MGPDALLSRLTGVSLDRLGLPGLAAYNQARVFFGAWPGLGERAGALIVATFDGRGEKGDCQAGDHGSSPKARLRLIRFPAGPSLFFNTRTWAW